MPKRVVNEPDPVSNRDALVKELAEEWRNPQDTSDPLVPSITLYEGGPVFGLPGKPLRIEVVWDKWEGISPPDRTAIVMDVFQQVAERPEDILRVTLVTAWTHAEAKQHGACV